MNDQIKQMIQGEVASQIAAARDFNVTIHTHDDIDSPKLVPNDSFAPYRFINQLGPSGQNGDLQLYKIGNDFGFLLRYQQTWIQHSLYLSEVDAYNSGTQSIANNSDTTLAFNTEIYDTSSEFASNTFTAKTAGKYLVTASTNIPNGGSLRVRVNGTIQAISPTPSIAEMVLLAVGDTITISLLQTSGGSQTVPAGRTGNWVTIKRLS